MNRDILLLLSKYFYYKPIELRKIIEGFKNIEDVLEAPKDAFFKLEIAGKALDNFLAQRNNNLPPFQGGIKGGSDEIKILTILDEKYPKDLKNIYGAPAILFYRGDLDCLNGDGIAVIGSRKMTEYGRRVGEFFVRDLCKHLVIVSGLAYGIDGLAHKVTVENSGKTIAVLGSGLDDENIYPKSNAMLAKNIINSGGLLLSEVPPGVRALPFHFPMRNRIIAGLSYGILVVEGGQKSGTLITAKLGIDFGIDVFAVPNNIFYEGSKGVNYLIKCGAHLVSEPKDILEFYGVDIESKKSFYKPKNDAEKNILEKLGATPITADELGRVVEIDASDLIGVLTNLEMSGVIKNIGGKFVKL